MSRSDEDAIREIEHRFNAAWDRHDPNGMAEALANDAQFITVNGAWTTTRDGFRDLMQRLHGADGAFRTSTQVFGQLFLYLRFRFTEKVRNPLFAMGMFHSAKISFGLAGRSIMYARPRQYSTLHSGFLSALA